MLTIVLGALLQTVPLSSVTSNTVSPSNDNLRALGSCVGGRGPVSLSRVMFLENRILEWDGSSGPIRITLPRQSVNIKLLRAKKQDIYIHNIGRLVGQGDSDADVHLKLALLDNRPVIYWRETYQHRIYRQGIFSIVGHNLVRLCEGEGGEAIMD